MSEFVFTQLLEKIDSTSPSVTGTDSTSVSSHVSTAHTEPMGSQEIGLDSSAAFPSFIFTETNGNGSSSSSSSSSSVQSTGNAAVITSSYEFAVSPIALESFNVATAVMINSQESASESANEINSMFKIGETTTAISNSDDKIPTGFDSIVGNISSALLPATNLKSRDGTVSSRSDATTSLLLNSMESMGLKTASGTANVSGTGVEPTNSESSTFPLLTGLVPTNRGESVSPSGLESMGTTSVIPNNDQSRLISLSQTDLELPNSDESETFELLTGSGKSEDSNGLQTGHGSVSKTPAISSSDELTLVSHTSSLPESVPGNSDTTFIVPSDPDSTQVQPKSILLSTWSLEDTRHVQTVPIHDCAHCHGH